MSKKKILFLLSNLETGGVTKSALNLLNSLDYKKYDVDLFLISKHGPHGGDINANLKIIHFPELDNIFEFNKNTALKLLFSSPIILLVRLLQIVISRVSKGYGGILLSKLIPKIRTPYDFAIDYHGQHLLCYMTDRVTSKVKISFFHSDYDRWDYYYDADKIYYPKINYIFTVSDYCVNSMRRRFPQISNKIQLMENIISIDEINFKANIAVPDSLDSTSFKILTTGHVCENKGTDLAILAANILRERGLNFKWYFIGVSNNQEYYNQLVSAHKLEDYLIFKGSRSNPYPYLKQCDLFVLPSSFEGKSIALEEAKLMTKPIVVTNFSTVNDQFENRTNASICEMNSKDLADKIQEIIEDDTLRISYINNLIIDNGNRSTQINKLANIFDN